MLAEDFVLDEQALRRMERVKTLPANLESPFINYEITISEVQKMLDEKLRAAWRYKK